VLRDPARPTGPARGPASALHRATAVLIFVGMAAALLAARHLGQPSGLRLLGVPGPVPDAVVMAGADVSPRLLAMQRDAVALARWAGRLGTNSGTAQVVRLTPTRSVLVLLPRQEPYTAADLLAFPQAATAPAPGEVVLRLPVVVMRNAVLDVDSARTSRLRLASSPAGFATLIGLGGSILLTGSDRVPLDVGTVDPGTGGIDRRPEDGRGFVLDLQGRMNLSHVRVSGLGFGQGMASGIAWVGTAYEPARGTVTHSTFSGNRYGAYTFHAIGMTWTDDVFEDNQVYGLAAQDFSSEFVIRDSLARRNGRHGFALSRGCQDNVLDGNVAEANLGDGFALDDAPLTGLGPKDPALVSTGNRLRDNTARSNGGSGIDVHGGSDTTLLANRSIGNRLGVRYAATASGTVQDNQVHGNTLVGIRVEAGAGDVVLRGNSGSGSRVDLLTARPVEQAGNGFDVQQATRPVTPRPIAEAVLARAWTAVGSSPALAVWLVVMGLPGIARVTRRLLW